MATGLGEPVMADERSPRIVVGVSPSLAGLAALRLAVDEARRRGIGQIIAVRSWPDAQPGPVSAVGHRSHPHLFE